MWTTIDDYAAFCADGDSGFDVRLRSSGNGFDE